MDRWIAGIAATLLAAGGVSAAHAARYEVMRGGVALIKTGKMMRFVARPQAARISMTEASNDPRAVGARLRVADSGGAGGVDVYELPADGWRRMPRNENKPLKGYRYRGGGTAGDPCTAVVIKSDVVKATCRGRGVTLVPPFAGDVSIALTIGSGDKTFCCSFGGTEVKNQLSILKRKISPPPDECELPGPTTTTIVTETTSTTVDGGTTSTTLIGETTTTTVDAGDTTSTTCETTTTTSSTLFCDTTTTVPTGETTSTTLGGGMTTTTVVGETTSTTLPGETTTTVVTGETTTTTIDGGGGCCNGAGFVSFATIDQPGDCGDIQANNQTRQLECAGLYTGGGGNSVPLPLTVPDLGQAVSAITACTGQSATLGGTSSAETGRNTNCTDAGCLFGAPLAVPNPGTPPTSVCVLNQVAAPLSGTADCSTGATDVELPLASILFLTGDTATDPGGSIDGVQPCPLCSGGTCVGGPNNGMPCTPGTTELGGDPAYPTSHDCPPDPMFNIGTLPIAFRLTTGTINWNAVESGGQTRVFSGFCRDGDGTGAFEEPANPCLENGMAVGGGCSGTFESCQQRSNGAFGPNGGAIRTITAIGSATSLLGGAAPGTLVSVFSIPPTFNATVDAAGDLPGPGAVALPGTATLCTIANPCP